MRDQPFKCLFDQNKEIYANLFGYSNECPFCHFHIQPELISHYINNNQDSIYVTLLCPNKDCDKPFVAFYERKDTIDYDYVKIMELRIKKVIYSNEIKETSPNFIKIYNEANIAEQNNLFEICGVGYRKALEYLIKDYLINEFPIDKTEIIRNNISICINKYIKDTRIKSTAERAIWLGNDHTHYEKIWKDNDLSDLKTLIRLTTNWIETEILTKRFNNNMNNPKKVNSHKQKTNANN